MSIKPAQAGVLCYHLLLREKIHLCNILYAAYMTMPAKPGRTIT